MKKIALILSCILLFSCKENKEIIKEPQVNVAVTNAVSHDIKNKQIECDGKKYKFDIPIFNSKTDADIILNHPIKELITKNFIDVTYNQDAELESLIDIFINRRNRVLCLENKNQGLLQMDTHFITDTEKIVSYEIDYVEDNSKGRLLTTFLKPDLKEIQLDDIIQENKDQDVLTIFNANLQQAVANLVTQIPAGDDQNEFVDYVRHTSFKFDPQDFKNLGISFHFKGEVTKTLRLAKKIELPEQFNFLNNNIVIEIDAYQLTHYLDLSRVID